MYGFLFYLFIHERHRQREEAPCREPDVGLHPGTPGSRPGPKAGTKPPSHPAIPLNSLFKNEILRGNFFKDFIYLLMRERERERERESKQKHRQREKQAPCREPDVGLDPRTPGSCPGVKAGAKPLSNPGIP